MCLPVAVPAHPRILAGRRFLRISPTISPTGVVRKPGDPILSTQRIPRSGDPIVSTQRIPRGRDRIFPTQRMGAMRQKMAIFKEGNSVCRVHFFQELSFYIQKEKIRGTMRQKMTIVKEGNSVCSDAKFKFHFLFQVFKFKHLKI